MPGPTATLLLAAARSKTVHRVLTVVVGFLVVMMLGVLTPLIAVPAMLARQGMAVTGHGGPTVVGEWGYPLAGDYLKGRGFGWHPVAGCAYCSSDHKGYDMSQVCGATIYAAGPGTVIRAGAWGSFGNAVQIDHGGGVTTIYGHMMWDSLMVQTGMTVLAGAPLGLEGRTGEATGCHLHFEVEVNGVPVDPEPFMADRGLPLK
jgi:murein DD-endopeptidase MepM/ murein hydrolase activator NlpD